MKTRHGAPTHYNPINASDILPLRSVPLPLWAVKGHLIAQNTVFYVENRCATNHPQLTKRWQSRFGKSHGAHFAFNYSNSHHSAFTPPSTLRLVRFHRFHTHGVDAALWWVPQFVTGQAAQILLFIKCYRTVGTRGHETIMELGVERSWIAGETHLSTMSAFIIFAQIIGVNHPLG